jgi:hypothetical protein
MIIWYTVTVDRIGMLCLPRIPDLNSRIPDPTTTKKRRETKNVFNPNIVTKLSGNMGWIREPGTRDSGSNLVGNSRIADDTEGRRLPYC